MPHSRSPLIRNQPDLHRARDDIRSGNSTAAHFMGSSLEVAHSLACANTFRSINAKALEQASTIDQALPLAGLAVSVKDLFDISGDVTASGTTVLTQRIPAVQDAVAVQRLKAAGGVVIGRTHMVELAFSGMGVNPHFGTPVNPAALAADPTTPRIPGGSSSGAAVSVASGAAFVGLGSDTGGSIRIPAALCGLVGFKPTARLVPTTGAIPLSHSLDSLGALTRSVRDSTLVHNILSGQTTPQSSKSLSDCHFAIVISTMQDGMDAQVAAAFERSVQQLSRAGAKVISIELPEVGELGTIQARGGFSAPEIQAWMIPAGLWPHRRAELDPRVAQRIALADQMTAADYVRLQLARRSWIERVTAKLEAFDAVLSPTVPLVAAPIAQVAPGLERDAEFFRINALMLRNTSVVNFLDGCGISLPNQTPGELPTGLMLWHGAMHDQAILHLAAIVEQQLQSHLR